MTVPSQVSQQQGPLRGGVTVTLRSSTVTGQDQYGVDVRQVTSSEVSGCAWIPGGTAENIQGTIQVTADAECYLPSGTIVTPEDQITYQGVTYRVMGAPATWTSPFTNLRGPVMVRLKVVTGA